MLSEHERRVLNELESDLAAAGHSRRARSIAAITACRLPLLVSMLATIMGVAAAGVVQAIAATALSIPAAAAAGWLAAGTARRHGLGLRFRIARTRRRLGGAANG